MKNLSDVQPMGNPPATLAGGCQIQSPFTPDGDIKSASLAGAVFEVFQLLELKEKLQVDPDNPDLVNRTAISVDVDNAVVTISATLPITFSAGADLVTITANTYLA